MFKFADDTIKSKLVGRVVNSEIFMRKYLCTSDHDEGEVETCGVQHDDLVTQR